MDKAFILPLPQSKQGMRAEEGSLGRTPEFRFVQRYLEKLRYGKISWDVFFHVIDPINPMLRTVTTREGENILHLAALANQSNLPKILLEDESLRWQGNQHGLTPIDLERFLCRHPLAYFAEQPGVVIESSERTRHIHSLLFVNQPVFEETKVLYHILSGSQKAKTKDLIPPEKTWMGVYFDKEIQCGIHPAVSIRFVDNEVGFGVFAEQKISPCAFVGEYTGIIQERKSKHVKDKKYCVRYTVWEMGRRNFVIDAEKTGNFTRFINHSSTPNLSLQSVYWRGLPRMIFIALNSIEAGTQLTFDYGTFFWKECRQTPKNLS